MEYNKLIPWTAFSLFILSIVIVILMVFAPTMAIISGAAVWVLGVLALLSAILGFVAFKTPQGKIAAIGGLLILLAILFIIPATSTITR